MVSPAFALCGAHNPSATNKTMRRPKDKLIAGIDLHSNNVMISVINQDGKRITHRNLDCGLGDVLGFLKPLKLIPKNSQPPCRQQPSFGNSGSQRLEEGQSNDCQRANPGLLSQLQNA
jgi:hypothetical protein